MQINRLLMILAVVFATAFSSFGQKIIDPNNLPAGVRQATVAEQQQYAERIKAVQRAVAKFGPGTYQLSTDAKGKVTVAAISPTSGRLGNIATSVSQTNEVIALLNLRELPTETFMFTFLGPADSCVEIQSGFDFAFGGCEGCTFPIEPGNRVSFLDVPTIYRYGAVFFHGPNTFAIVAEQGVNGAQGLRFIRGNPQEDGRYLLVKGSFQLPVVATFATPQGFTWSVEEAPDVTITNDGDLQIDLQSERLQGLTPGDYFFSVSRNNGDSDGVPVRLSLDNVWSYGGKKPAPESSAKPISRQFRTN